MKRQVEHTGSSDSASGLGPAAAQLYVASFRNILQRQVATAAIVIAALPVLPAWAVAIWALVLVGLVSLEVLLVRSADRMTPRTAAVRMGVTACATSIWFALAAVALWLTEVGAARLFAVVLVCTAMLYLLMQYYARPRFFWIVLTPQLATIAAGVLSVGAGYIARGEPWHAATPLLAGILLFQFFYVARLQLARSRKALFDARIRAQESGEAAEAANAAKSAFLAGMSHEIRTPLNGVLGMAQAMAADTLTPLQRDRLDVIRQSGEALLAILNDVLDLSKIEAGRLDIEQIDFDIEDIARGAHAAFTALANAKGLSFDLHVAPEARGAYRGDPIRLRQILYNLLSNALKFTEAGEVRVKVDRDAEGALRLVVADTGCGIDPERMKELFAPFVQADASTTRRFGGTGLGLAICRHLAEAMGGRIAVESIVGEGSRFTVVLPLPQGETPTAAEADPAEPPLPAMRVLAAEDNTVNQLVLRTLLHQIGVEPVLVGDGAAAIEAWRREAWDVILMDVQMPVMDGPTAAALIRREEIETNRPRTPILALTANAMSHQIAEYLAAGMDGHVGKPIEIGRLYAALAAAVEPNVREAAA